MRNFLATIIIATVPFATTLLADEQVADEQVADEQAYDDYYRGLEAHDTGNLTEAVKWYRLAVRRGVGIAQFKLGAMYAKGHGVPYNIITAHMWLNLAGLKGIKSAVTYKGQIAATMTAAERDEARRRSDICLTSNFRNCD
jgi:uncharacterized protein